VDISFITPCFNSEKTVLKTLESVQREACSLQYEHLLIDGGSEDGTEQTVKDFASSRVQWYQDPDDGAYDGMNRGIARARGRLVAILNSDDYYSNGAIDCVIRAEKENPTKSLFCGNTRIQYPDGREEIKVPDLTWRGKLGIHPPVWHPSMIVRREVYERVGVYNLRFPIVADIDFFFRALDQGEKVLHIDQTLTVMKTGGLSTRAYHQTPLEMMEVHRSRPGINGFFSQMFYYKNRRFRGHGSSPAERWKYWSWAMKDLFFGSKK